MFVEEVLHLLASNMWLLGLYDAFSRENDKRNEWDISFLTNVDEYVRKGNQLSTEQSRIILKLLSKFRHTLIHKGIMTASQIDDVLRNPTHKQPLYLSANIKKEVRYLGGNYIGFRFQFNDVVMKSIRELVNVSNSALDQPHFNREYRIWIVPIIKENALMVRDIIFQNRFSDDSKSLEYIEKVIRTTPSICTDKKTSIDCETYDNDLLGSWAILVLGGEVV